MTMNLLPQQQNGNHDNENSTFYPDVTFQKTMIGCVTLTSTQLQFVSSSSSSSSSSSDYIYTIEWKNVLKHQVSPVTYPKSLLKINMRSNASLTFQMKNRIELEKIRKDITKRLQCINDQQQKQQQDDEMDNSTSSRNGSASKKRSFSEVSTSDITSSSSDNQKNMKSKPTTFGEFDTTSMAVTRASLLAANPTLRKQHHHLVEETGTIEEEDFWRTHQHLIEEEYARIVGVTRAGTSSILQSHLPSSGRITLGVQEMRQIFILYPAVHKAYEEKVPLELSDEQFWKKYLESEFFHKDRGRIGTAARNHAPQQNMENQNQNDPKLKKKITGPTFEQQEARAAAVGTDDLFSRYDQKLQEQQNSNNNMMNGSNTGSTTTSIPSNATLDSSKRNYHKWGRQLAIGQFDLASTYETERGYLLEGPKDIYPSNVDSDKGSRVIQKYNRHWAMVLHPEYAVAGANLLEVSRRSIMDVLPNDVDDDGDANAYGGVDKEMRKLVQYANATDQNANHATGDIASSNDGPNYEPLTLKNIEAYYSGQMSRSNESDAQIKEKNEALAKKHVILAKTMVVKTQTMVRNLYATSATTSNNDTDDNTKSTIRSANNNHITQLSESSFPAAELGRELLTALTQKMVKDSKKEQRISYEIVKKLPEDFRNQLQSYFRRSSELLRHFFGLRKLDNATTSSKNDYNKSHTPSSNYQQKLQKIVQGMETFYREMESMRKNLPENGDGEIMRKMCLPIMDQLDWAFKLHREENDGRSGRTTGSSGGFVTVEEL